MVTLNELTSLLEGALDDPARLEVAIEEFQRLVHGAGDEELALSPADRETVRELALDLEYFVASPLNRAGDPSYFGPDRARREIAEALAKLRS